MAAPALVSNTLLCSQPFQLRLLAVTTGADAGNIAHGMGRIPDAVWVQSIGAIDNSNEVSIVSKDATNLNIDCEDDGNNTVHVFVLLFDQASGGYSDTAIPLTAP
jgi:hypothetical protein